MEKQKTYDWRDTNMALFGSDVEKNIKKESAEGEKAWEGTGKSVGLSIWRINKFKVQQWPKEEYGNFFTGDSYIVLNVYKVDGSDDLKMDVHFWIGKFSSQDEYATAAYKTVELDTFHDDVPVQHREVQEHESELFKSYFKFFTYLEGGCDTGFNHVGVNDNSYKPRLLMISTGTTKKKTTVTEVDCVKGSLNESDCFILDKGAEIILYHGPKANMHEKSQGSIYAHDLEANRRGKSKVEVVDELESMIPEGESSLKEIASYTKADDKMLKLSNATGKMTLEVVDSVELTRGILNTNDIFFIDNGAEVYVWSGKAASVDERRECMMHTTRYLNTTDHPFAPITVVNEGHESADFWSLFTD